MPAGSYADYSDPPVVEPVLGLEFTPLDGWKIPHFGLLWERLKSEFTEVEDQLALPSQIEDLESVPRPVIPRFEVVSQPSVS